MIQNILQKIKALPSRFWDDLFLVVAIFLIALASFGLGRLSVLYEQKEPIQILYSEEGGEAREENYIASLSGSRYHLPWCPGAQSIKEENKIWFESEEAAEIAGYTPAANCPGI